MEDKVSDKVLEGWAEKRADDAGRLARELISYRRAGLSADDVRRLREILVNIAKTYFPMPVLLATKALALLPREQES